MDLITWMESFDIPLRFFAESLSNFFETLIPLSDSLLAGNPATAGRDTAFPCQTDCRVFAKMPGRKVGNSKDQEGQDM